MDECVQAERRIIEYLDHSGTAQERIWMFAHLTECPVCRQTLRDWLMIGQMAREAAPAMDAMTMTRTKQRLMADIVNPKPQEPWLPSDWAEQVLQVLHEHPLTPVGAVLNRTLALSRQIVQIAETRLSGSLS